MLSAIFLLWILYFLLFSTDSVATCATPPPPPPPPPQLWNKGSKGAHTQSGASLFQLARQTVGARCIGYSFCKVHSLHSSDTLTNILSIKG